MISKSLDQIKSVKLKTISFLRLEKREVMSKRLSKYIASFDYFDNYLIILSATSGEISIASFSTVVGAPVGIASVSFSFTF